MSAEPPEARYLPFAAADLTGARVVVLATHTDDETFSCGGALAAHRTAGDPVHVIFVTSGEQGDWTRARTPAEITQIREAEAGRALFELGVDSWAFWRLPDRCVTADGPLVERIADLVLRTDATLLYAPSPLDVNPDHRAVAAAVRMAVGGWPGELRVAWYEQSVPIPVDHLVDVTPHLPRKERALRHYASQLTGPHDYASVVRGFGHVRRLSLGPAVEAAEGFRVTRAQELDGDRIWRWAALQEPPAPRGRPAVTVVLRTRDRPDLLGRALGSLAQQTMRDFEVVVVNDAGAEVRPVLNAFPELRTRELRLATRAGRAAACNAGVEAARGALVAYLDDDDVYLPEHLEGLRAALDGHAEFGVAHSDADLVRAAWDPEAAAFVPAGRSAEYVAEFDADRLIFENTIPNLAVMHRRELWERVGGFDETLELLEDWDFLIRLAAETSFVHVPRRTAEYRMREGSSVSARGSHRYVEYVRARDALFERHRHRLTPDALMRVFHASSDAANEARAAAARARRRIAELEGEVERARVELEHRDRLAGQVEALAAHAQAGAEREAQLAAEAQARADALEAALAAHVQAGAEREAQLAGEAQARVDALEAALAARPVPPPDPRAGWVVRPRAATRRIAGAVRDPVRAARWARTSVRDPRSGLRRLAGR